MPWYLQMHLRIFPFLLIAYLYTGWRVSRSLATLFALPAGRVRAGVGLAILCLNLLPILILFAYRGGRGEQFYLFRPQLQTLDYLATFPFWIGLIVVVEILPYFLALDLAGGVIRLLPSLKNWEWNRWKAGLHLAILAFFAVYVGIRSFLDTSRVRLETYRVEAAQLPPSMENLTLTFISDVQVDRYTGENKLKRLEEKVRQAGGDLLLFGGDMVTSGEQFNARAQGFMCELAAPLGRIACMGDHDYWSNSRSIPEGLRRCGWTFLQDRHHLIEYKGSKILITGVTHIYSQRIPPARLKKLLAEAPAADLKIFLIHQPSDHAIRAAREYGYHLVLAGHTHGGQIVFRPFGIPLAPTRFENRFYSGFYHYRDLPVIVTNGVGLTLAPLRYQAPAEVVKVTLARK